MLDLYTSLAKNADPIEDDPIMVCVYALLSKLSFICGIESFDA
jgi:hypothetical protein